MGTREGGNKTEVRPEKSPAGMPGGRGALEAQPPHPRTRGLAEAGLREPKGSPGMDAGQHQPDVTATRGSQGSQEAPWLGRDQVTTEQHSLSLQKGQACRGGGPGGLPHS